MSDTIFQFGDTVEWYGNIYTVMVGNPDCNGDIVLVSEDNGEYEFAEVQRVVKVAKPGPDLYVVFDCDLDHCSTWTTADGAENTVYDRNANGGFAPYKAGRYKFDGWL